MRNTYSRNIFTLVLPNSLPLVVFFSVFIKIFALSKGEESRIEQGPPKYPPE